MKTLITLFLAFILILSFGMRAAAYFEEGHLIQVVYERGGAKEIVTDLGDRFGLFGNGLTMPYAGPIVTTSANIDLADLGATSWDHVYVAYFMRYNQGGDNFVWVSDTSATQRGRGSGGNALISKIGDIAGANAQTGQARNLNLQSDPNSFSSRFGTDGTFLGFLTSPTGEASLEELGTRGYVDQTLYFYDSPTNARNTYEGRAVLGIRTHANGTIEMTAVPQPYLLSVLTVGNGKVTSSDGLIDCGSRCAQWYRQGTVVSLTALPDAGTLFAGWSGDCSGTGNCALEMIADRAVTANFSPQDHAVTLSSPADGVTVDAASLYVPLLFSWNSRELFEKIEIQFSTDNFASIAAKITKKGYVTETYIPTGSWKKILRLPGSAGGRVFWRVAGYRANRSTAYSPQSSFTVKNPETVSDIRLSHVSRTAFPPPTLSWKNNANVRVKIWFGNSPDFSVKGTKKKALTFTIKDPLRNEGMFTKQLTIGQWKAVRQMVGDAVGQPIYYFVESWDGIKRYSSSEVMSFILGE